MSSDTAPAIPGIEVASAKPDWVPRDAAAAWAGAVEGGWPSAGEALDAYLELLSHGDADCPGEGTSLDDSVVRGCTSEEGYGFSGISTYEERGSVRTLHADMRLDTPGGAEMRVGGTAYEAWSEGQVQDGWDGTWVWEGSDGPLAEGVSGHGLATWSTDGAALEGALGFSGVSMDARDLVVAADGTATGTLGVRDPAAGWHEVTLGGSACGAWTWEGEEEGEACLDFSGLLAHAASRLEERGGAP